MRQPNRKTAMAALFAAGASKDRGRLTELVIESVGLVSRQKALDEFNRGWRFAEGIERRDAAKAEVTP